MRNSGLKRLSAAIALGLAALSAGCATPATPATPATKPDTNSFTPITLEDTDQFVMTAETTGRRYPIWVALPSDYATSEKAYPVVITTDAANSFPMLRAIRSRAGQGGDNIEDFILIGLMPQEGVTSTISRSRDYTPTKPAGAPGGDYEQLTYGEAGAYRDFIASQLLPELAARYRIDPKRKTYIGHSYGALFGTYVLLTQPSLFESYILSSPSLWFDDHAMERIEQEYAAAHGDLAATVHLTIGSYETVGDLPRNHRENDMVRDNARFAATLRARNYPSLKLTDEVINNEDHVTVFPDAATHGLLLLLPGAAAYNTG